ncbi:hypothetical protein L9F63_020575, partial [Diploptera punctata]
FLIEPNVDQQIFSMRQLISSVSKPCSFVYCTHSMYMLNFLFKSLYYERYSSKLMQNFEDGLIEKLINIHSDSNFVPLKYFSHLEDKIKNKFYSVTRNKRSRQKMCTWYSKFFSDTSVPLAIQAVN